MRNIARNVASCVRSFIEDVESFATEESMSFVYYTNRFSNFGADSFDMRFPENILINSDAKKFCLFNSFYFFVLNIKDAKIGKVEFFF